jgi:hypothetical protein
VVARRLSLLTNQTGNSDGKSHDTCANKPIAPASLVRKDGEQANQNERHSECDEVDEVPSSERMVCLVNWHTATRPNDKAKP